jgi:hypothetical protein
MLGARAIWFDVRRITLADISGREDERAKRDIIKYHSARAIQRAYRLRLGRRMWAVLMQYKKHQAANLIQSVVQKYLAIQMFTGKKNQLHQASSTIARAYKSYRRRQIWSGMMSCIAARRRENVLNQKKLLVIKMKEKERLRALQRIKDDAANIMQSRLSFYYAIKKNWRIAKAEEDALIREEEEKQQALEDMANGLRKFGATNKVEKEEWQKELEVLRVEKRLDNLQQHIAQRKFGVVHRTIQWLRFQASNMSTTKETRRKRGLPDLVPIRDYSLALSERQKREVNAMTKHDKLLEKAQSSVKRFQRGAVPVMGLVDISWTVGDNEFEAMKQEQKINEKAGRRFFTPMKRDLSRSYKRGNDGVRMPLQRCIMWTATESRRAKDLLCDIKIVPLKPGKNAGTAYRIHDEDNHDHDHDHKKGFKEEEGLLPGKDIQIVRHKRLPFELWLKRRGVTPLVAIQLQGKKELKNRFSGQHPQMLKKHGYVKIEQRLDGLPAMKDKVTARLRNFCMIDSGMFLWVKSVNTKADARHEKKALHDQLREGKKIQNICNMCMLESLDLNRLFNLFSKIQHYGYKAKRKSAKSALQRKKLDKLQKSADAFNTIPVDAVHLYLTEPKTPFTEFFWRMVVTSTGDGMKDDMLEDREQHEECERIRSQVRQGVFTVEGEGIDSQDLTFAGFCQSVCRFALFEEAEVLALLFALANPVSSLVSPFALIQVFKCLHGNEGPSNHARQNIRKVSQSIGASTGSYESRHLATLNSSIMQDLNASYPAILYPAFRLQRQIQKSFLGTSFWNHKKKSFAAARKRLIETNFS